MSVLSTLAFSVAVTATTLAALTDGTPPSEAVFQPAPAAEICTNLVGTVQTSDRSWLFNDGERLRRDMPPEWQRGEPIPGQLFVADERSATFVSHDGETLRVHPYAELHCTIG